MCGIVGYLRKAETMDQRPLGAVTLEMLRALSARGPDSAGVALYRRPARDALRVRVKLVGGDPAEEAAVRAAAGGLAPVRSAARQDGCLELEVERASPGALEAAILAAAPGAEVFSIGERLDLVKQVGHPDRLAAAFELETAVGSHGLGHTRLSTESRVDVSHSQPFWAHGTADLAVVHNGHITNYHRLRRSLERRGHRFYTENDSEILGPYLQEAAAVEGSLEAAMARSTRELDGTFCYLVATADGLGFAKDFFCSKPLVMVETDDYLAIATEELAIRRALPDAPAPVEPGANAVGFWRVEAGGRA
jgi:glutamate synthase domain-containing protein 1